VSAQGGDVYEYKVIRAISLKNLERELNDLASKGWRVVTGAGTGGGTLGKADGLLIMERPKK
jgi:Domain of unknown function (DUF4177)